MDDHLQRREKLYFKLSSDIAQIDTVQLRLLFDNSSSPSSWAKSHIVSLGGSKVFVKRLPMTRKEYDNMFSTANIYDLPTYYNYPFGSAGLGVFRELVAHIKTTNWVLQGAIASFPLLYHYRIIPFAGEHAEVDMAYHARYLKYWGSDANVGSYVLDRARAQYELVLFLEHFPRTVDSWLVDNSARVPSVLADMQAALTFLMKNGILHLDAHFQNMLTDGKRAYLTDFGLALDRNFELTPEEKLFYRKNSFFDYGLLLWSLLSPLTTMYLNMPDAEKMRASEELGIGRELEREELMSALLRNIDNLNKKGLIKVAGSYRAAIAKYQAIIVLIQDFYSEMRRNDAKDTSFANSTLQRLLKESGFISDPAPRDRV